MQSQQINSGLHVRKKVGHNRCSGQWAVKRSGQLQPLEADLRDFEKGRAILDTITVVQLSFCCIVLCDWVLSFS